MYWFPDSMEYWTDEQETKRVKRLRRKCNRIYDDYCRLVNVLDNMSRYVGELNHRGYYYEVGSIDTFLQDVYISYRNLSYRNYNIILDDLNRYLYVLRDHLQLYEREWNQYRWEM